MRHYFWVFIEKFGVLLIKVLTIGLLARVLTPNEFGLYAMTAIVVSVASVLVDSGMAGALIRKQESSDLDYSTVFIFNIVISCFLYCLVFLGSSYIASFYNQSEIELLVKVLGLTLIIRSLGLIHLAKLTKELKFKSQSFIYIASGLFSLVVAYVLAIKGFGYWALVGQQIADSIFTVAAFWFHARYFPRMRFSVNILKEHFDFGSKLMFSSIIAIVYGNIVNVIAGKSLGANIAGLYSQANKVNEIFIGLVTTIIDKTSFPLLVKHAEHKHDFVWHAQSLLRVACFISFLGIAVLVSCAELVVNVLLGEQWGGAAWMLQVVAFSGYGLTVEAITRSFLKSQGRSDIILRLSLIKGGVSIVVLLLLAMLGLKQLLWGVVFLSGISAMLNGLAVSRLVDYSFWQQVKDFMSFFLVSLVVVVCITFFIRLMTGGAALSLIVSSVMALCLYCLLAYLMRIREYHMLRGSLTSYLQSGRFNWF